MAKHQAQRIIRCEVASDEEVRTGHTLRCSVCETRVLHPGIVGAQNEDVICTACAAERMRTAANKAGFQVGI